MEVLWLRERRKKKEGQQKYNSCSPLYIGPAKIVGCQNDMLPLHEISNEATAAIYTLTIILEFRNEEYTTTVVVQPDKSAKQLLN